VPAPVGAAAREVFTAARARGHGGADFSSIVDAFCEMVGVEKPRLPAGWKPPT
jgi:4-hydroxybutyrate dehydrogenase/sulfolactaldehyde 3-reductase